MPHRKTYTYAYHRKGVVGPCYARKTVYTRPNSSKKRSSGPSLLDIFADSFVKASKQTMPKSYDNNDKPKKYIW